MFVHPLREDVHINKKPLPGGTFRAALEGSIQVLLSMVVTQRQPEPQEDSLVTSGRIVEIPE
jgi:hypothetical protein